MLIKELIEKLNEIIPESRQESWDNSGIQFIDLDREIEGIVFAMDVLDKTIDFAIENSSNLIISHHPFFFEDIKSLSLDTPKGNKLYKLVKNDIFVYSLHTNFDLFENGVSIQLAKKLGLDIKEGLMEVDGNFYGAICEIEGKSGLEISKDIREKLGLDHIISYGNLDKEVKRLALMGGSGGSFLRDGIKKDVDLYISGDIKYHEALDSVEEGLLIFDIGHFHSEFFSLYGLRDLILNMGDFKTHIYKPEDRYLRKII